MIGLSSNRWKEPYVLPVSESAGSDQTDSFVYFVFKGFEMFGGFVKVTVVDFNSILIF